MKNERAPDLVFGLFLSHWAENTLLSLFSPKTVCPMGQSVEDADTMDKIGLSALTK